GKSQRPWRAWLETPKTQLASRAYTRKLRRGTFSENSMKTAATAMIATFALLVACILGMVRLANTSIGFDAGTTGGTPLVVLCAASNRAVFEAIKADYEQEFGTQIQVQYGPSEALLTSLEISRTGDLFLPADAS